ncbi:MAG: GNAT family N-acetyltransferase [Anaerolineales bacterium]|nr:GNAT family N-acetyltransferase [Anaerolineales bacterium]
MNIEIAHSLPEETWGQFVQENPMGNIFHTPEMFMVMQRTQGYKPNLWAAVDHMGRVFALLLPVQVTLNQRLRYLTSRAIAYGSVLYNPCPQGQQALALLLQAYRRQADKTLLFTELRNLANLELIQPVLQDHGFLFEAHLNYLVDLKRSLDDVLQGIGSRTRKNIRRGLKRQTVSVEEVKDRGKLSVCYELLNQTYTAAHVPLAHPSLFEAAFDLLSPIGMVRFTLAYVEQTPVATSVDLVYKDVIYGWYGGTNRDYSAYMPTEMVTWDILRWGVENGYRVYDFGGAGKPDEESGVRDFKAKFGGELVNYGRNTLVHAPMRLAISQTAYELARWLLY